MSGTAKDADGMDGTKRVSVAKIDPLDAEMKCAEDEARHEPDPCIGRVERKMLKDFKRDLDLRNVLIQGRWLVRGTVSMFVSTTGTGKSILQTQAALCFNRGVECCGLRPVRPFRTWVIQSEDDEDRVAIDRDDIAAELKRRHAADADGNPIDWDAAMTETAFLDFTGKTGVDFLEALENELRDAPPDLVIINPFNAYFGGDLKAGKDASAFFKGGVLNNEKTDGLEAILKRHHVAALIFAHTGKPPTAKEQSGWLNDAFSAYKMCGASEIADAVRSIITFLPCPQRSGVFVFTAGKNGRGLGWTDAAGKSSIRALYQWGDDGRHYWQDVPKESWQAIFDAMGIKNLGTMKTPPPPPPDETPIAVRVFEGFGVPVTQGKAATALRNAINAERLKENPPRKPIGEKRTIEFLEELDRRGVIKILPQGSCGTTGKLCGLPQTVKDFLHPPLLDVPPDAPQGKADDFRKKDDAPFYGRSKRFGKS